MSDRFCYCPECDHTYSGLNFCAACHMDAKCPDEKCGVCIFCNYWLDDAYQLYSESR